MSRRAAGALAVATVTLALVAGAGPALAQEPVQRVDWAATAPLSGEVVDGNVHLTADAGGSQFPLARVDAPDLGTVGYAIRGRVRYSDVTGPGYLEMWSAFADGSRYFSRTLGTEGPMAALAGSSDWRDFELPFELDGAAGPKQLEVNVVLPAAGSVDVSALELVRLDAASSAGTAWLSDRAIGVAGALIGTTVGLLAAAIATLTSRRRGRRFVLTALAVAAGVGVAFVIVAVYGLAAGQPANVVLLLLVPGLVLALAFGAAIPRTRLLYADAELRKMRAMDHG